MNELPVSYATSPETETLLGSPARNPFGKRRAELIAVPLRAATFSAEFLRERLRFPSAMPNKSLAAFAGITLCLEHFVAPTNFSAASKLNAARFC
jgi:hypothetical protein